MISPDKNAIININNSYLSFELKFKLKNILKTVLNAIPSSYAAITNMT